jgi:hypothetical protein
MIGGVQGPFGIMNLIRFSSTSGLISSAAVAAMASATASGSAFSVPRGRRTAGPGGSGGLSYTHTGMRGLFAFQEGVRQVRGEAAAQVNGPDISVVLGNGGMFATAGVLVLGRHPR